MTVQDNKCRYSGVHINNVISGVYENDSKLTKHECPNKGNYFSSPPPIKEVDKIIANSINIIFEHFIFFRNYIRTIDSCTYLCENDLFLST